MADARASIEKLLSNVSTQPVVFSKSYCPYCKATKGLLSELGYEAVVTELDQVGTLSPSPSVPSVPPMGNAGASHHFSVNITGIFES